MLVRVSLWQRTTCGFSLCPSPSSPLSSSLLLSALSSPLFSHTSSSPLSLFPPPVRCYFFLPCMLRSFIFFFVLSFLSALCLLLFHFQGFIIRTNDDHPDLYCPLPHDVFECHWVPWQPCACAQSSSEGSEGLLQSLCSPLHINIIRACVRVCVFTRVYERVSVCVCVYINHTV